MLRILPFLIISLFGFAKSNSNGERPMGGNTTSEKQPIEIKSRLQFNLEELKVRLKKAVHVRSLITAAASLELTAATKLGCVYVRCLKN